MQKIFTLLLFSTFFGLNQINAQQYFSVSPELKTILQGNKNGELTQATYDSKIFIFKNSYLSELKKNEAEARFNGQYSLLKNTYDNASSYPVTISDGWHFVFATNHYKYCSQAKALVHDNKIVEIVADDWKKINVPFTQITSIEKGKALVNLSIKNNYDTTEIYFINDLQLPTNTEPPVNSGYISFWSDINNAESIKIIFDGKNVGQLSQKSLTPPNCGDASTITLELKPGTYKYKALGKGSIHWEGEVVIKENSCLDFNLNKQNNTK